jgi:cytochrome c-type biogenesis protein CcmH
MLFWAAAIFLTVGAVLSVLLPFVRSSQQRAAPGANDLEVYRDQLAELDRDAARGLIGTAEFEEARAEIGRRVLKIASGQDAATQGGGSGGQVSRGVVFAAVAAVPLVSWGFYSAVGAPDMPSQPLAARLSADPATASIDVLVARAEAHLQASPDDGRGWDVLAPIYFRLGRYPEAQQAYGRAIELLGATANREAGLGEAIAAAAGGMITAEAAAAFERGLQLEPGHTKSAFLLASALAQQGKIAEAADGWRAIEQRLPADSPWLDPVRQAIAEAERRLASVEPQQPGPDAADIEAAAGLSAQDREAMVASMVARLDERLKENPKDAEGWQRLVRSYVVLGKSDEAREALSRGMAALGEGTPEAAGLTALATSLGLVRTQ